MVLLETLCFQVYPQKSILSYLSTSVNFPSVVSDVTTLTLKKHFSIIPVKMPVEGTKVTPVDCQHFPQTWLLFTSSYTAYDFTVHVLVQLNTLMISSLISFKVFPVFFFFYWDGCEIAKRFNVSCLLKSS